MSKKLKTIIVCALAAVCLFSGAMIIFALISNSRSNNIYGEIQSNLESILYPEETETKNIIWTRGEDEETISEPDGTESEVESEPESITEDEITDIETDTDKNEPEDTSDKSEPESETSKEPEETSKPTYTDVEPTASFAAMKDYIIELQKRNTDIIGIIHIPISYQGKRYDITYPIMHTDNNSFYLDHNIDKEFSREGSIFADKDNNPNVYDNKNFVLYGHNMYLGSMFHSLVYMQREEVFYTSNIFIYTAEACFKYEIISVQLTDAMSGYIQRKFGQGYTFMQFMNDIVSGSLFKPEIDKFYQSDRVVTLSTCYGDGMGRLAVHGVLVERTN